MIRQAVGAVVETDGRVLLVYKVKGAQGKLAGKWDLPKGGVEPNDCSLEDALLRELREETGSSQFKLGSRLSEPLRFAFDAETSHILGCREQVTELYRAVYTGDGTDLVPLDEEIAEVAFFSREEALPLLFPETRRLLASLWQQEES
ncbi:hypothetical protein J31TS4_11150 [Paenibacillus sp. J31TS4]|nr:hypothetical protein J31TS4_11150 [Paenibacillus sp. J31TS4]